MDQNFFYDNSLIALDSLPQIVQVKRLLKMGAFCVCQCMHHVNHKKYISTGNQNE